MAHFRDTDMQVEGVRGDTIIERPTLDLAGRRISPPRFGCTGTENNTRDTAQNVTVRSVYACAGGLLRVADAKFARVNGEWIRTDRAPVPFGTPSVRLAAGAPVTTEDVLEVARLVDPAVAEAWVTDRHQVFALTGKELVSLADRGMPSRVIDMLVAVSNPATFTMQYNDARMSVSEMAAQEEVRRGEAATTYTTTTYGYGMMGIGWMYGADTYYGWSPYPSNRFGYYGNQYGYGNYWGGYNNRGSGPPVIIVGPPVTPQVRGRAVYGQGYTRSQPSSAGSDMSSRSSRSPWSDITSSGAERGRSTPSASPRSAPAPSTGGSSSGSSSVESGGRTAKARGGGN